MKFIKSIFGKKHVPNPKDNYELIAMNLAMFYCMLRKEYKVKDEEQLLLTSGVLDTLMYLEEGTITFDDIKHAFHLARHGKCSLYFKDYFHEEDVTALGLFYGVDNVKNLLLNFALQIECLIFYADSNVPPEGIISTVISKKNSIKKIIEKTIFSIENGSIDSELVQQAHKFIQNFFSDPEFTPLRIKIGIDHDKDSKNKEKITKIQAKKLPIKENNGSYKGEYKNGNYHGYGIYTSTNGSIYEGEWKGGKQHGKGTYTFFNGNKYQGEWRDGKRTGQGTYTWANGDEYTGEWKDGKRHGWGTFNWANGSKYEGEWVNNQRHGSGTYITPEGDEYTGGWKEDMKDGQGVYLGANGDVFRGKWKYNKRNGFGAWKNDINLEIGTHSSSLHSVEKDEWEYDFLKKELGKRLNVKEPIEFKPNQIVQNTNTGQTFMVQKVKGEYVTVKTKDGDRRTFKAKNLEIISKET